MGQSVCEGDPATFNVVAGGVPPFSYQWRKNGVDIPGENSETFTIPFVTIGDAGGYNVTVTDNCGTISSGTAILDVNSPTSIVTHPMDQSACEGDFVTISVTPSGTPPFAFQWRKNGIDIPGANASTYIILDATPQDSGLYDCVVTAQCGTVISDAALLTVFEAAAITDQPVEEADFHYAYRNILRFSAAMFPYRIPAAW